MSEMPAPQENTSAPINSPKSMSSRRTVPLVLTILVIALVIAQIWTISRVQILTRQLDYVTQIAENADRYAHTHY